MTYLLFVRKKMKPMSFGIPQDKQSHYVWVAWQDLPVSEERAKDLIQKLPVNDQCTHYFAYPLVPFCFKDAFEFSFSQLFKAEGDGA
jgi:hypothetical protein